MNDYRNKQQHERGKKIEMPNALKYPFFVSDRSSTGNKKKKGSEIEARDSQAKLATKRYREDRRERYTLGKYR